MFLPNFPSVLCTLSRVLIVVMSLQELSGLNTQLSWTWTVSALRALERETPHTSEVSLWFKLGPLALWTSLHVELVSTFCPHNVSVVTVYLQNGLISWVWLPNDSGEILCVCVCVCVCVWSANPIGPKWRQPSRFAVETRTIFGRNVAQMFLSVWRSRSAFIWGKKKKKKKKKIKASKVWRPPGQKCNI